MEKKNFWNRSQAIWALMGGLVFGIAAVVYAAFPAISGYLWCFYVGYFMTVITGSKPQNFIKYVVCFACGYFWAWAFWYGTDIVTALGVTNYPLARGISDCIITIVMLYIHCHLLGNTIANTPPLMFAAVATIFGNHGFWEHLPKAGASLFCGMASCLICTILATAWINLKSKQIENEQER